MAIYHFNAKVISRSAGRSAVASAAYRASDKLVNEREGITHDFTKKQGVIFSEILAPENAPDWVYDRNQLWNNVERSERRKDAQLARDITLALPHELTILQREELVKNFVKEKFVNQGMIADVAIHLPDGKGDDRNHHAHIMLTMRDINKDGFGAKNRSWNDKALLTDWRKSWEQSVNQQLERHGHHEQISSDTLEAQGINRLPTKHLGVTATQLERKGVKTERGDQHRAILVYNSNTASLDRVPPADLDKEIQIMQERYDSLVEQQQTTFTTKSDAYAYILTAQKIKQNEAQLVELLTLTPDKLINNDRHIMKMAEELERKEQDIEHYKAKALRAKAIYEKEDKKLFGFGGNKAVKAEASSDYQYNYKRYAERKDEANALKTALKDACDYIRNNFKEIKDKMAKTLTESLKPLYEHINKHGGRDVMDTVTKAANEQLQQFNHQERLDKQAQRKEQGRGMSL